MRLTHICSFISFSAGHELVSDEGRFKVNFHRWNKDPNHSFISVIPSRFLFHPPISVLPFHWLCFHRAKLLQCPFAAFVTFDLWPSTRATHEHTAGDRPGSTLLCGMPEIIMDQLALLFGVPGGPQTCSLSHGRPLAQDYWPTAQGWQHETKCPKGISFSMM